jgi:hypothetical protein
MILKGFLFFLLPIISSSVFAQNSDGVNQYLRSKSFKCKLSQEQFRNQIRAQVDRNIKQLETNLKERGSELQSITQQRDHIEIGVFPQTAGFDFYVLEPVTIVLGRPGATLVFQIQSTYYVEDGRPTVQKGLWFPLAVHDPGSDKPCELVRVVISEKDRRFLPSIDLTMGDPPRTLISRLIDVIDVAPATSPAPTAAEPAPSVSPIPERWPQPSSVPPSKSVTPEPSGSKDEPEIKPKKKKRYERPRHHYRRRHHYHRRYRRTRNETPAPEPPQPQNECSGDLSTWKAVTCTLTGQKTD